MGIYLNPGNENFKRIINAEIFVDKTMMIRDTNKLINSTNNLICVSRPRRFGKTIAQNMLTAYYSKGCDSRELFSGYMIEQEPSFEKHLNMYNVIKIDMNSEYQSIEDKDVLIKSITDSIKEEMRLAFPQIMLDDNDTLARSIQKIHYSTGETFIVIIDEYDVLVREQVSQKLFDDFLSFLNGLFKSDTLRPAISLAYLTGILPIVRDKVQSKLNNFREYTFISPGKFAPHIGFTSDEVKQLCEEYNVDFEECRHWYDGYELGGYEIYNPESVVMCIEEGYYEGYWGKTSSYQVISDRIEQNFEGIKDDVVRMLSGEAVDVNVSSYMNTMNSFNSKNDVFTYLSHLGYLSYNRDEKTCHIPNREIRQEWLNAIEPNEDYKITNDIIKASKELLNKTIDEDAEAVAKALDISHIHIASNRSYNNEDVLQSAIYLAYIYALNKYTVIREATAGKGFADVVFVPYEPKLPAMVIELKSNKTAQSGLKQIKDKKYYESLELYKGNMLLVGINYDENTKEHKCVIERYVKE